MMFRSVVLTIGLALAAPTCATPVSAIADDYLAALLVRYPEQAQQSGLATPAADRFYDASPAALTVWQRREDSWRAALDRVESAKLTGADRITYGFLRQDLDNSVRTRICRQELWPVEQMSGWAASYPDLAGAEPVGTPANRAVALRRWITFPAYLQTEIVNLEAGLAAGYSTPRHNVELVIAQIDGLLAGPVDRSPMYAPAATDPDPTFRAAWTALLTDQLHPAMRAYRDWLTINYLPKARTSFGVLALPNGAACYRALLQRQTSLPITPKALYDQGIAAVADRTAKAKELAQQVYGSDDLSTLRARLDADPANHFASRKEIQSYSQAAIDRAQAALPRMFAVLPVAPVDIQPIPAFNEEHSVPYYLPAAADGSRPGSYMISLYKPERQNRSNLEAVAFHETVPGHHLQLSLAQQLPAAHPVTQMIFNGGFVEGWAVYAETLSDEMGLYSTPLSRLGEYVQLPTGMVADPGVHLLGWSRQQTIDYFLKTRPDYSPDRAASQADRIAANPGQLTTYFTGALEIMRLRRAAEAALGPRFDIRIFHAQVLGDGSVTLPMLQATVEAWVAATK
jgi:uncharacterized protein (DUF885 family)